MKKSFNLVKQKTLIILLMVTMITISGCTSQNGSPSTSASTASTYTKISAKEAKEMMTNNSDAIILDVRTLSEYKTGYIAGAILIPDNEIKKKAEITLKDKSATILIYCRSGRRSAIAAKALVDLGYTNIYDFGGIADWTYDIVVD